MHTPPFRMIAGPGPFFVVACMKLPPSISQALVLHSWLPLLRSMTVHLLSLQQPFTACASLECLRCRLSITGCRGIRSALWIYGDAQTTP